MTHVQKQLSPREQPASPGPLASERRVCRVLSQARSQRNPPRSLPLKARHGSRVSKPERLPETVLLASGYPDLQRKSLSKGLPLLSCAEQAGDRRAGIARYGGSSYIDLVICRDRDTDPESGGFETRDYVLQNWRADVVALAAADGDLLERISYDPYGVPFATHPTDLTLGATPATAGYGMPSGVLDSNDSTYFTALHGGSDWRADWNRDGSINATDNTVYLADKAAATGSWGRGVLSNKGNILGYAGYVHEPATGGAGGGNGTMYHCRMRVHHAGLGRWIQRDPPQYEYGEGPSLYLYGADSPLMMSDWIGGSPCPSCGPGPVQSDPVLPPTNPGNCASELSQALNDPAVQAAIASAQQTCGGVALPPVNVIACPNGNEGGGYTCPWPFGSERIDICTLPNGSCPGPTSLIEALIHEFKHFEQSCRLPSSNRCREWSFRTCQQDMEHEVEAYCAEPSMKMHCDAARHRGSCAAAGWVCAHACDSVLAGGWCDPSWCHNACLEMFGCPPAAPPTQAPIYRLPLPHSPPPSEPPNNWLPMPTPVGSGTAVH